MAYPRDLLPTRKGEEPIFVDANIFMYFVDRGHPLRVEARAFFHRSRERDATLVTSAEVLQEILHRYLRQGRRRVAGAAFELVEATVSETWPVEHEDVSLARNLAHRYPGLEARRHPSIFHSVIPPACFPTSADATRVPDSMSITSTTPGSPPTPSTVTIA